jgi:hypothetical protein
MRDVSELIAEGLEENTAYHQRTPRRSFFIGAPAPGFKMLHVSVDLSMILRTPFLRACESSVFHFPAISMGGNL